MQTLRLASTVIRHVQPVTMGSHARHALMSSPLETQSVFLAPTTSTSMGTPAQAAVPIALGAPPTNVKFARIVSSFSLMEPVGVTRILSLTVSL